MVSVPNLGPNPIQLYCSALYCTTLQVPRKRNICSIIWRRPLWLTLHHRIQFMPHWYSCISVGKVYRIGPLMPHMETTKMYISLVVILKKNWCHQPFSKETFGLLAVLLCNAYRITGWLSKVDIGILQYTFSFMQNCDWRLLHNAQHWAFLRNWEIVWWATRWCHINLRNKATVSCPKFWQLLRCHWSGAIVPEQNIVMSFICQSLGSWWWWSTIAVQTCASAFSHFLPFQAKHAAEIGADGIAVIAPSFFKQVTKGE